MQQKKGIDRKTERIGWGVAFLSFFCGATYLLHAQEERHHEQLTALLFSQQQSLPFSSSVPVEINSVVLPPSSESQLGHAYWVSGQFEVMKTEISADLFQRVRFGTSSSKNPQKFADVASVQAFANALSQKEGHSLCYDHNGILVENCTGWRIPFQNEWMLFANAGQGTLYSGSDVFADVGWETGVAYTVGSKPANQWGLHDMSGGREELVFDTISNQFGLIGDERTLQSMRIRSLEGEFAVRLIRRADISATR